MTNFITFIITVSINEGKVNQLQEYFEKVVHNTKSEEGTLIYSWSYNDEKTEALVIEQYADIAGFLEHAGKVDTSEVAKIASFTQFNICGNLPDEMKTQMNQMASGFYSPMQGHKK